MGKRSVVAVAVLMVALTWASRLGALAPVVFAGVLVAVILGAGWWMTFAGRQRARGPAVYLAPLAAGWLVVSILPTHNFAARSTDAATTSIGLQPIAELAVYLLAGLVAAHVVRTLEPTLAWARPPTLLFLLPIWVVASAAWSATGPYAFVRGCQMMVPPLLAWATIALGRADRAFVDELVQTYLRWFVRIVAGLVVIGLLLGPLFVAATASNLDRFTWIGAHPTGSGRLLSAALVIVAVASPRVLGHRAPVAYGGLAMFAVALYANHTRTAWVAVGIALAVAFVLAGRVKPLAWAIGAPVAGFVGVLAVRYHGAAIGDYILRDDSSAQLSTGNGRRQLWGIGARALDTAFDWIAGLGYGAARTVFLPEAPWAGSAHNSVLSLLVGVGLVGVALFVAVVAVTARDVVRAGLWKASDAGLGLVALAAIVVVHGAASDTMAEPNFGFVVLNLAAAAAAVYRDTPAGVEDQRSAEAVSSPPRSSS